MNCMSPDSVFESLRYFEECVKKTNKEGDVNNCFIEIILKTNYPEY